MSDYQVKPNERNYVHVRFVKITKGKDGRTTDVHTNQMFSVKEFEAFKKFTAENGLKGATQYHEYVVLHDPRKAEAERKPEAKPAGRPKKEVESKPDESQAVKK